MIINAPEADASDGCFRFVSDPIADQAAPVFEDDMVLYSLVHQGASWDTFAGENHILQLEWALNQVYLDQNKAAEDQA